MPAGKRRPKAETRAKLGNSDGESEGQRTSPNSSVGSAVEEAAQAVPVTTTIEPHPFHPVPFYALQNMASRSVVSPAKTPAPNKPASVKKTAVNPVTGKPIQTAIKTINNAGVKAVSPMKAATTQTAKPPVVKPPPRPPQDVRSGPTTPEKILLKDLAKGKEANPVRVINIVDDTPVPKFKYISQRETAPDLQPLIDEESALSRYEPCCTSETCGQLCEEKVCPCRTYSGTKITYRRYLLLYQQMETYDNVTQAIKECNYSCYCHKAKNKAKKGQISCYNRTFSKGAKVSVDIFRTEGRGWGVRSREVIREGEYIGEYVGMLKRDVPSDVTGGDYVHGLGEKLAGHRVAVDAEQQGNYTRFINHSCDPNVFVAKVAYETTIPGLLHLCLFALKEIKAYEEILIDYGYDFWVAKASNGIYCKCETKMCHHPHAKLSQLPLGSQLEMSEEEDVGEEEEDRGDTEVYDSEDDDEDVTPESTESKSTTGSGTSTEIEV
ncbi:hypothetical protein RvY_06712 [Ramazzottius varieornatus]|uniref:SET domain-containing protein n=1 Tax=Ramazzottius varieornatus TaxID=947166 RepID=A0A1D1V870_RAMVA|nr:hypothetical protein RvY_06712 [Ramazzottius varieornatus]